MITNLYDFCEKQYGDSDYWQSNTIYFKAIKELESPIYCDTLEYNKMYELTCGTIYDYDECLNEGISTSSDALYDFYTTDKLITRIGGELL